MVFGIFRRCIHERERGDPVRIIERYGLRNHPAHGNAAQMHLFDFQRFHQANHVRRHHREGIWAGRRIALAVAACIVAQNPKPFEGREMKIPIAVIAGEAVIETDDWRIGRATQHVIQIDIAHANPVRSHCAPLNCRYIHMPLI